MNIDLARAYVIALTGNVSAICDFRAIHDTNKDVPAFPMRGTIDQCAPVLSQWNDAGYGIFMVVNEMDGSGLKLPNVLAVRAHYVDLDKGDVMQNYSRITAWQPAPSFAVNSSPGKMHVYWCSRPYRDNARFEETQRKLVASFGGDRAVIDATRVMRLPGTIHRKDTANPHLVTCHGLAGAALGAIDPAWLEQTLAGVQTGASGHGRRALGDEALAAPSLEWALAALKAIDPNNLDRASWITVTSAWKQAAWNHSAPHMVRFMWEEWCARYIHDKGNDIGENDKQWNSIRDTEVGFTNLVNRTPSLKAVFMFGAPSPPPPAPMPDPPPGDPDAPPPNKFGAFLTPQECAQYFNACTFVERFGEMLVGSGRLMGPQAFNGTFGGKKFIIDENGSTTDEAWKAALRSTLWQVTKVDHLRFVPQQTTGTILKDALGRSGLNIYRPISVPRNRGDIIPFLRHMELIMPNADDRRIYLDYLAHNAKFPGYKIPWAPLLQSEEGAGKGIIKKVCRHVMGGIYIHEPNAKELIESGSKFNAWMRSKLMIIVDEIRVDERRDMIEVLKPMISEEQIEIQGKGVDQETEDNYSNWIFFSNFKDAIPVRKNGRRFAIFYSAIQSLEDLVKRGMDQRYFDWLYAWLDRGFGREIVADWLLNYPIECGSIPMRAPSTSSTNEALEQSRSPMEALLHEAIADARPGFRGGWISSAAASNLIKSSGFKPNNRAVARIIEEMGYKNIGRATRAYFQEDAGSRPVLYAIHMGADVGNYAKLQGYE